MRVLHSMKTRLVVETSARVWDRGKYREVVLEAEPGRGNVLLVRLKGTRQRLPVLCESIWNLAAKAEADRIRTEKKANGGRNGRR